MQYVSSCHLPCPFFSHSRYEQTHAQYPLDPDTVSRHAPSGMQLVQSDADAERQLLHRVFMHLRRGSLERAVKECVDAKQFYRAATLRGGELFEDTRALGGRSSLDLSYFCCFNLFCLSLALANRVVSESVECGNPHRDLWKRTCWAIAHDVSCAVLSISFRYLSIHSFHSRQLQSKRRLCMGFFVVMSSLSFPCVKRGKIISGRIFAVCLIKL